MSFRGAIRGVGLATALAMLLPLPAAHGDETAGDRLPKIIKSHPPVYPEVAFESGIEGRVYMQARIGTSGEIEDVWFEIMDDFALEKP